MAMFGKAMKGLASPAGSDLVYLLGATLKDLGGGGSDNFLMAQQQLDARRKKADEEAAFADLAGLFGGGAQPSPVLAGGQGADTLAGGAGSPRPTGWSVLDQPTASLTGAGMGGAGNPGEAGGMTPEMRQRLFGYYSKTKNLDGLLKLWSMDQPTYERGEDGYYEMRQGVAPKLVSKFAEKPREAPSGYRWSADGTGLEAIPGGPGDPKVIDLLAGLRREAIVSRPIAARPRAGGGGRSSASGSTGLPPGFTPD